MKRLRLGNTEPFAIETCFLDGRRFGGLLEDHLERRSLYQTLEDEYDIQLAYADEEVDATSADVRSAELLAVPRGAPLLRIRQLLYCKAARPIVYAFALYRSDRHCLLVRRFR